MTTTLRFPADASRVSSSLRSPLLCLGDSPFLESVADAMLSAVDRVSTEPDALMVLCEDSLSLGTSDLLGHAGLSGRAVGLIAVTAEVGGGAVTLARVHGLVRRYGGFPVGSGLCLDVADLVPIAGGERFGDVTVHARLTLLSQRVRTLARSRRVLRAA